MPDYVLLSILAAIALGGYSVLTKTLLRYRFCNAGLVTSGLAIATGLVSALVLLAMRSSFPTEVTVSTLCLAVIALGAQLALSLALQEGDTSTVVPLLSLKIPLVAVLSLFILGESHPPGVYGAAAIAALGVAFFGVGRQQKAQGGFGRHPVLAVALACLSALLYALLDQVAKRALSQTNPLVLALWVNLVAGCICLPMLLRPHYRKYRLSKADLLFFAVGGVLMCGGIASFFGALHFSDGVLIPNIVLSTRGFFALMMGFTLGQALKIPMERQPKSVYALRTAGSFLLLAGLIIALV